MEVHADLENVVPDLELQIKHFPSVVSACLCSVPAEMFVQLSRVSHTLSVIFPPSSDELNRRAAVTVNTDAPWLQQLHLNVRSG